MHCLPNNGHKDDTGRPNFRSWEGSAYRIGKYVSEHEDSLMYHSLAQENESAAFDHLEDGENTGPLLDDSQTKLFPSEPLTAATAARAALFG